MVGRVLEKLDELSTPIESTYSECVEIERHFHNNMFVMGAAASPSGETNIADEFNGAIAPFTLISGSSAYGSWVQILGSLDTPIASGMTKYDFNSFLITGTNDTNAFCIQIISGESSGIAAKLSAKDYTNVPYIAATNSNDSGITYFPSRRHTSGEKVWARCACYGQNAKTISFYICFHEYID